MQDYQTHLEKLRTDAAECALIRDLATDPAKRELRICPRRGLRLRFGPGERPRCGVLVQRDLQSEQLIDQLLAFKVALHPNTASWPLSLSQPVSTTAARDLHS